MAMESSKMAQRDKNEETNGEHRPPVRGRPRIETPKPTARGRSPRTACNFCHDKRVKCVMKEGESRCEQCIQRDTSCVFSTKGKTGPKPKNSRSKADAPRQRSKGSRTSGRRGSAQDAPAVVTKPEEPLDIEVDIAAAPVAAHTAAAGRERAFLGIYALTIGKLVPLVTEEALRAALAERQRFPMAAAAAVGVERIACDQAQVVGAISLGALISGDVESAKAYHFSLRYHIGDVQTLTESRTAPSLALAALYWQHRGEDELNAEWVGYARRVLGNVNEIPVDLVLSIEYLDYAREAHVRPGIGTLPASRRALHSISCLLSNMPVIVNPPVGQATAVSFCEDLSICIRGLRNEASVELSLLLCSSLKALLLVMLGRRNDAITILETMPPLIDPSVGGNPSVVRALPLSWDALLIASALSFLLGQGDTYRRLRAAVERANLVPAAARWTFCLPDPGSDPQAYVAHECHSSSNICNIMCEIASKTGFGRRPFYPGVQSFLRPPTVALSPSDKREAPSPERGHRSGYGAGGMAMRGVPPIEWQGGSCGGGVGGGGGPVLSIDGGEELGGGGGGAAPVSVDLEGSPGSRAQKRRRVVVAAASIDGDTSGAADAFLDMAGQTLPPLQPAFLGATAAFTSAPDIGPVDDPSSHHGNGKGFHFPVRAEKGAGAGGAADTNNARDDDDDDDGGSGLTKGLHNMSLSRLSVPLLPGSGVAPDGLHQDHGPLGRIPSEGIMDISSSIGSFSMDIGAAGEGAGAGSHHSGDEDGAPGSVFGTLNGKRRSCHRLSSFSAYSTALCRSGSMLRDWRSGGMDGSTDQGSDLGHEIVVAAENFVNAEGNEDICGNILSVDAILGEIEGSKKEERWWGGGAGGGSNSNGGLQSGGGEAGGPSLSENQKSMMSHALGDF